ncbi:hypothetical protein GJAV_G00122690 [Gymnothorax javanicus]|nr:hypothetical protein GJAV_G00122690 [Gymnothorax javanicus]
MRPWRCLTTQEKEGDEVSRRIDETIKEHRRQLQREHRVCILGFTKSGASTLLLQLKTIYGEGYSVQDRKTFTKMIFQRIFTEFKHLTNGMSSWNKPYSNPENQLYAQWIQEVDTTQVTTLDARYAHALRSLWDDQGIKTLYVPHLDSTEYYMNNLDRIAAAGYIPNELDILWMKKNPTVHFLSAPSTLETI